MFSSSASASMIPTCTTYLLRGHFHALMDIPCRMNGEGGGRRGFFTSQGLQSRHMAAPQARPSRDRDLPSCMHTSTNTSPSSSRARDAVLKPILMKGRVPRTRVVEVPSHPLFGRSWPFLRLAACGILHVSLAVVATLRDASPLCIRCVRIRRAI